LQCAVMLYSVLQRVAACCSVLQCVAERQCESVVMVVLLGGGFQQCGAACCSVLQHVAACCSVLQCVATCCSVSVRVCRHRLPSRGMLQECVAVLQCRSALQCVAGRRSVWQCGTVYGSVWQCDTGCCSVLQGAASFAVCCSVLQSIVIIVHVR